MTQTAVNYAQALYDLALKEKLSGELLLQLRTLAQAFDREPEFPRLLAVPNISKQERCQILEDCFRDLVHPYVLSMLKLMTEKGCIRHFSQTCKAYENRYNADHGILSVLAVTAAALRPEQSARLQEKLEHLTGKTVCLENRVDPECLGGVSLRYDGALVDGTVRSRLEEIGKLLKNTVL